MPNLIIWYIICLAIIVFSLFITLKFKFSNKTVFNIMAVVSLISEMCKILTHVDATYSSSGDLYGYYLTPASLPFHLCSLLIFAFFYLSLSKNDERNAKILEFIVPVGLIGGILGDLFATSGTSFTEIYPYQCFIYHSFVVWFALYFIITKQVNLGIKSYKNNILIMFALSIFALWMNSILKSNVITEGRYINFMFLAKPPMDNLPFLNLDHGWTVYYLHLMFAGLFLLTLVHAYYIVKEFKTKNNSNNKDIN